MASRLTRRLACLVTSLGALLASASAACASTFEATVIRVSDGDSVWVQPADGSPPRVLRLLGIDAPETCQAHGRQARAALAQRALGQPVRVQATSLDRYHRLLARLATQDEPDLGAWMVAQGHAWSYRLREDPGPYVQEEAQARQARRGLWAGPSPQEPRAFRREHGPCR